MTAKTIVLFILTVALAVVFWPIALLWLVASFCAVLILARYGGDDWLPEEGENGRFPFKARLGLFALLPGILAILVVIRLFGGVTWNDIGAFLVAIYEGYLLEEAE